MNEPPQTNCDKLLLFCEVILEEKVEVKDDLIKAMSVKNVLEKIHIRVGGEHF